MCEDLLKGFLSPDNNVRSALEKQFEEMIKNDLQNGIQILGEGLMLQQIELAEMSSVLICRFCLDRDENFSRIPPNTLNELAGIALKKLQLEGKFSFLKRMSDLIVKILLRQERYDEMVQWVLTYKPETTNQKLALMYFIEIMCEFAFDDDLLVKYAKALDNVFNIYFNDQDAQVRVATLKSVTIFLASIENTPTLMKFQDAAKTILSKCVEAIKLDQESSVSALQSVSELLEQHPKFLQNFSNDLICLYTEIMKEKSFLPELRRAALHGLQTLSGVSPVQVRKNEMFKTATTQALMQMLCEVDSDDVEWENNIEDISVQSQEISAVAQDCLAKMTGDLSVKFLLPLFIKMIIPALQSQQWKVQHGGLIAMAMLSEGSSQHFQNDMDSILQAILPLCQSNNIRVIYDVLGCFAFLCQEFHPTIQKKYGKEILQLVVACMQQRGSIKLQYRGTSCLVDFSRELVEDVSVAKEILSPYAQCLLEVLYKQVQDSLSKQPVLEKQSKLAQEALTSLSCLAAAMKESFSIYYDTMMPVMLQILQTLPKEGDQYVQIIPLLIECMGFMLSSIAQTRKDQFSNDAQTLMTQFLTYQQGLVLDDTQHPSLFSFYTQVAIGMKQGFAPYLPQVFMFVERAIKIDLGFSIGDNVDGQKSEKVNSKVAKFKIDLKFAGLKSLELNTSALEIKIEGAHTLLALVESCGKSFTPFLQQAAELVNQYISFKNSRDIRETMVRCLHHMMLCCNTSEEQAMLFNYIVPSLLKELQICTQKKDSEAANVMMDSLSESIELMRHPMITDQVVEGMLQACVTGMQLCKYEKQEILKEYAEQEQDVEQQEQLQSEYENIDSLMDSIVSISTQIAKLYKLKVEGQIVNNLMPLFYELLVSKQSTQNEIINSIAFFNTVLINCSEGIFERAFGQILPTYIQKGNDVDLSMRQNVLYGLGEFATIAKPGQYVQLLPVVNQLLASILNEPDVKSESKINSYETAIGTMGKLGLFQSQAEMMAKFVNSLPLTHEDAQETHLMLLKQIELQNPNLMIIKDQLQQKLIEMKTQDNNNPENEILCDEGRQLINKLLQV